MQSVQVRKSIVWIENNSEEIEQKIHRGSKKTWLRNDLHEPCISWRKNGKMAILATCK